MKCLIAVILISVFPLISLSEELEETKIYRLNKTIRNLKRTRDNKTGFIAVKNSKFVVVDVSDTNDYYVVRFLSRKKFYKTKSTVSLDEEYKLPKQLDGVDVSKSVRSSVAGPVSGPLVVPFKFRLDDESITGEAVLGYYAGYKTEPQIPLTNITIPISPFIAGGISQVSVTKNGASENKSGFTWATGLLIQNWANVNIGIVYGQDRTGDKDWDHEAEGWFSFMIGWEL